MRASVELLMQGKVKRDNDTPLGIASTCNEWFDGEQSAMARFYDREAVSIVGLGQEAARCLATLSPNLAWKERPRLEALLLWTEQQHALMLACQQLQKATDGFLQASRVCSMQSHETKQLWDTATKFVFQSKK